MIISSGDLLCSVVDDVLDFSKLQSGKADMEVKVTSLQDILNTVVHGIEFKAQEKDLELRTSYDIAVPKYIETDSRRLQQILFNLLGNAVKFSNNGGTIELNIEMERSNNKLAATASCEERPEATVPNLAFDAKIDKTFPEPTKNSHCPFHRPCPPSPPETQHPPPTSTITPFRQDVIRIVVKDYGRGIDKKDFGKIFQPFLQAKSRPESVDGGTGLGLAITSRLVEHLGGTISVDSEFGKWSKFTVELPCHGHWADVDGLSKRLEKAQILYLSDQCDTWDTTKFGAFRVPVEQFKSYSELESYLSSINAERSAKFHFFFVHEEMYRQDMYERLEKAVPSALVTLGPNRSIPESHCHFRKTSAVLPCVMMESLASCVEQGAHPGPLFTKNAIQHQHLSLQDLRALIAEDNVVNQKVLRRMLDRLGMKNVDIANNGKEAVEQSAKADYDIIFMDMQMPIMDGLEATRIIVNRRKEKDSPKVVFVTAHVSSTFETQALNAGADGFISKPFDIGKIGAYLRSLY